MKRAITSNLRPLLRGLYPFLIVVAALWAMPRNARAQLYVIQGMKMGFVSEYSTKGELINGNFITGLGDPTALAVSGNSLFVANFSFASVGKYDATNRGRD